MLAKKTTHADRLSEEYTYKCILSVLSDSELFRVTDAIGIFRLLSEAGQVQAIQTLKEMYFAESDSREKAGGKA